ncbi:hypothetical protein BaRGS_00013005 [Batillaria attramentaria]|uniref:Uncharacterized protein n=1 Tax=Batillaria attramentaria TaxID=370345 RepID=A0ABD0L8W3_9CAEN
MNLRPQLEDFTETVTQTLQRSARVSVAAMSQRRDALRQSEVTWDTADGGRTHADLCLQPTNERHRLTQWLRIFWKPAGINGVSNFLELDVRVGIVTLSNSVNEHKLWALSVDRTTLTQMTWSKETRIFNKTDLNSVSIPTQSLARIWNFRKVLDG